ncbi:class I SAM-dependent methyltransferase [Brunnivagina elsteri]|uniref:SAM-dependent methyltransferase n=1 Tax=Brunnivagina elsteri CCALA 953 TaxID=987040 RepID=A0A2A2THX6_9CYAN|nr:class I SAM-dependent methyltransferase [Calothrix elsteri]PAX53354.1 SAM-dependent methyltransferase [Calothrix elsteri CCALA 953]
MNQENLSNDFVAAFFKSIQSKDLEQKKVWYSNAAEAYNKTRPRYPQQLINRVIELTQLPPNGKILEIGCGPGIATVAFAQLGFTIVCIEPNLEFCQLARQNCAAYPNVEIINTSFEEWELEPEGFDAVLAATSIHWVPAENRYQKIAELLKENAYLILLWNVVFQPEYELYQHLRDIYLTYTPSLAEYEDKRLEDEKVKGIGHGIIHFGQEIIDSGKFKDLIYEQISWQTTYSTDDYLMLLSSLSQYIGLDSQNKDSLFTELRERIENNFGENINFSLLSAFQIAKKL